MKMILIKINKMSYLAKIQNTFFSSLRQNSRKQNKIQKDKTKKNIECNLLQVSCQILMITFLNNFLTKVFILNRNVTIVNILILEDVMIKNLTTKKFVFRVWEPGENNNICTKYKFKY